MNTSSLGPLPSSQRIHLLDILRGFAIFGILVVNMSIFMAPDFLPSNAALSKPWYDQWVELVMQFFAAGKFYTTFSFLFGLGFALQITRAEAKGKDVSSFYPRRLLALFAFGVLHYLLFWEGDILRLYALLGFVLLFFRRRSNRAVLTAAAICFVLFMLVTPSVSAVLATPGATDSVSPTMGIDFVAEARAAYTSPNYISVLAYHARIFFYDFIYLLLIQGLGVMALFLIGLYIGRLRLLENLPGQRKLFQRVLSIGLIIGLFSNLVYVVSENPWISGLGYTVGAPSFAAVYVTAIALLTLHETWQRRLAPLACVGRMALTNYVLQSVICSSIFYGYGFGLSEKIGALSGLLLTLLIFSIQIPISIWWLKRFQYGPLEWLWRCLTYGKRSPFLNNMASNLKPSG